MSLEFTDIVLTGSTGFIGQHFQRKLEEGIVNLHCPLHKYVDLTNKNETKQYLNHICPEFIFHFAGNAITKENKDDPTALVTSNVLMTENLVAYAPKGCRFVFTSSATVYGDLGSKIACQEVFQTNPTSVYGASKLACEELILARHRLGKVNAIIFRLIAQVGTGATHGVLIDLVNKALSKEKTLKVLGEWPGSLKPYMHVRDTVRAIYQLGLDQSLNGIYNVSNRDGLYTNEIAKMILRSMNSDKEVEFVGGNWAGDNPIVNVANHKISKIWQPTFKTSKEAVQQAIFELLVQKGYIDGPSSIEIKS